jgi:hypothetical protein
LMFKMGLGIAILNDTSSRSISAYLTKHDDLRLTFGQRIELKTPRFVP